MNLAAAFYFIFLQKPEIFQGLVAPSRAPCARPNERKSIWAETHPPLPPAAYVEFLICGNGSLIGKTL